MNMTTTRTAQPHRVWPVVVLAALAAIAVAILIAVAAYAFTGSSGTDSPVHSPNVANPDTRTPGDGLPCPIHQPC